MRVIINPDWHLIGVVDITEPGSYEILLQNNGAGVGVRLVGSATDKPDPMVVDAEGVAHPCTPCSCCGDCGCGGSYGGRATCVRCKQYARWAAETRPLLERYLEVVGRIDAFVETNGRTHIVGCSSLKNTIDNAARALDAGCTHRQEWNARVPKVVGPKAPRRRRCAVCCPDVVVPTSVGPVRGAKGQFVAQQAPPAG
ncbi:hypothetical protein [Micromonospora sp. WMMD1155]|uniref:hypothetical protein n=1 Tax=Micromonospora sp. WMMD1155 TaxID=3016094 RepID=UPI00249BA143|nr:hypothetical protein [Micromonospora sp. WMMD1155]WFE52995.1 hypothetical protein O7617_22940 [Micromonospora sp. WMMD1155]